MIKIGDIFEIPLSNDRKAYGQYVFKDKTMGPLIQIFDLITINRFDIDLLKSAKPLFPPIITGLFAAIRVGMWKVCGHIPIHEFKYPGFINASYDERTGEVRMWSFWNGEKEIKIGSKLPEEFKNLEFLIVWNPMNVVKRIESGEYPYPYRELIMNNRFDPPKRSNVSRKDL